jgi:hypothetical protein
LIEIQTGKKMIGFITSGIFNDLLGALPPHLRNDATVYLLDPQKGYYVGRQGSNGYICLIARTEWEWNEFRNDLCTAISYDAEDARSIFPVYMDVAAMGPLENTRQNGLKIQPLNTWSTVTHPDINISIHFIYLLGRNDRFHLEKNLGRWIYEYSTNIPHPSETLRWIGH